MWKFNSLMFFTMCLGCRNKGVEDFSVAYSRTTHITAIGVVLAGKKAWSQPERGPFCLAHWSEGQTLALHNQQVLSYFWAFPGHFCRTRWWREAAGSFKPNGAEVAAPELQMGPAGQGELFFGDQQVHFLPTHPLTIGAVTQGCTDTESSGW